MSELDCLASEDSKGDKEKYKLMLRLNTLDAEAVKRIAEEYDLTMTQVLTKGLQILDMLEKEGLLARDCELFARKRGDNSVKRLIICL